MKISTNKLLYGLTIVLLVGWVTFRFAAIGSENARYVFNANRVAAEHGAPVEVLTAQKKTDVLKEPLYVKSNRAVVSASRVGKFEVGQKFDTGGAIISVSNRIDLDSGMYTIKTTGAIDGLHYAQAKSTGYFVPVYAIDNGTVFVSVDGVAQKREVKIVNQDADTALISSGLSDGDVVILSKVSEGDRVKYEN